MSSREERARARISALLGVLLVTSAGCEDRHQTECGGFGDEGCGEYGPPRHYFVSQRETRLQGALGFQFGDLDDDYPELIFALLPYVTLAADRDNQIRDCVGCSYLEVVDFEEHWGIHVTVGLTL